MQQKETALVKLRNDLRALNEQGVEVVSIEQLLHNIAFLIEKEKSQLAAAWDCGIAAPELKPEWTFEDYYNSVYGQPTGSHAV